MINILVCATNSYSDPDIVDVLKQLNVRIDMLKYAFQGTPYEKSYDDNFVDMFVEKYKDSDYDAVFSIDYFPPIAVACHKLNFKYIAWSYDCPLDVINPEETLSLSNVYCFVFDKEQEREYNAKGLTNVHHLPLSVNVERLEKIDSRSNECDKYRTEISFVGKLYAKDNSFPIISALVSDKTRDVLNKIIDTQRNLPQMRILDQLLTDGLIDVISAEMHENPNFTDEVTKGKVMYALECELAKIERVTILNLLGKRHKVDFYSGDKFDLLDCVNCHPYVNYWSEMPFIFAASKININPTLPAIHSGVNLRAFDITACGGFLLTNRQPEITDYFKENEEAVIYDSVYELVDKADYYLSHDSEREKIAKAGRERCLRDHSMKDRVKKIFEICSVS